MNNRWIRKAALIPWDVIEERYANLFPSREGKVAKPARMALGALLIQLEYRFSDEETAKMISENPYMQYFCGMRGYSPERPFDASLMVYFRKRFTPEIVAEINELVISKALEKEKGAEPATTRASASDPGDVDDAGPLGGASVPAVTEAADVPEAAPAGETGETVKGEGPNAGTMIVDATCAPSYIKYPQDTELLEEARRKTEKMISVLCDGTGAKHPRTYAVKALKQYNKFSRKRKKTRKEVRKMVGRELGFLKRNLAAIAMLMTLGAVLPERMASCLEVLERLYAQQLEMYKAKTHRVVDRIVSIAQHWLRPIVRGKTKAPVEFGVKLDVSVVDGYTRLEHASFSAYNESGCLVEEVERFRVRTGHYPEVVLADKAYRTRANLRYCKEKGIRLSGPALGRPPKDAVRDPKRDYRDSCERTAIERRFSVGKRKCGLGMIYVRLQATTMDVVALSILLLNLNKVFLCSRILVTLYLIRVHSFLRWTAIQ
jgi:hypothetical protein